LGAITTIFLIAVIAMSVLHVLVSSTDAYRDALAAAKSNPDVQRLLGENIRGGVENRRSGVSLPVAPDAAFARVASIRLGLALFPVPAHRTEQARFTHSALGESCHEVAHGKLVVRVLSWTSPSF
jgi:hypothetical protein